MAITFRCPHCDKSIKARDDKAGASANCPGCGQRLTVPAPVPDAPDVAALVAASAPVPAKAVESTGHVAATPLGSPDDYRPCPKCAESIRKNARRCRYCGVSLDGRSVWQPTKVEPGVILSKSWQLFGTNFGFLLGATLLMLVVLGGAFAVLGAPISLFFNHPGQDPETLEVVVVTAIYAALYAVFVYLQGGLILIALKLTGGEPAQISDLFAGFPYFWRIYLGHLLVGSLASVGFLMCVIPYFLVVMTFWPFAFVIVDQKVGVIESLRRSRQLTADNLATIFVLGLVLIGFNAAVTLTCGLGAILAIPLIAMMLAVAYRTMAGQLSAERS